jgi:tRNA G46 methylase TrmB
LVNERFVELAARALKPGGHFHVRTDDAPYFEQMLAVGNGQTAFQPAETPAELLAVVTDFEADFNAGGIPTRHSSWVRTDGPVVYQPSPNPPLAP